MRHFLIASPTILAAIAVLAVSLHALYRARRENREHRAKTDAWKADFDRQLAAREAELRARFAARAPALVMELDSADEDALSRLVAAGPQTVSLVSSLSARERELGGGGLTLTAAQVKFDAVRLTLSPVERAGWAERARRLADEWNARGGPLPPGVTAARADVSAA